MNVCKRHRHPRESGTVIPAKVAPSSPRKRGPRHAPGMLKMGLLLGLRKTDGGPRFRGDDGATFMRMTVPLFMRMTVPLFMRKTVVLAAIIRISYASFMREISDEKLMQQYAKGDAKAFDLLYARHRGALYRYFNRQVNKPSTATLIAR